MNRKLSDSELKVLDVLWREGDSTASRLAGILKESVGWSVNTTYTVIQRCVQKGVIARSDPGFHCHALVKRAEAQAAETDALVERLFDGSTDLLFASLLGRRKLSADQIDRLRDMVDEMEAEPDWRTDEKGDAT